ncbi:MAG: hypothetical protein J7647_27490 [Cyanobacteria bacterium SBLK]|nr:hypothetical protein [Cyanobacteria bacterium SBLK]
MKRTIALLFFIGLLSACDRQTSPNLSKSDRLTCPPSPASSPALVPASEQDLLNRFDFQIRNIEVNESFLRFQSLNHDFIFCRENASWTTDRGTFDSSDLLFGGEVSYQTVALQGQTYQYRAVLDPDFTSGRRSQRAILEVIPPEATEPIVTELYTLQDLRKAKLGNDLAYPEFVRALPYGDRLLLSVSAPSGEGFTGIATLAIYDPQTQAISLEQPEEIRGQIVTDIAIAGGAKNPKIWLTTQTSGEGNPYLPGMGLVSYDLDSKAIAAYHVRNSPLIGVIPTKLQADGMDLWVGTGNGICQIKGGEAERSEQWQCWRFAVMANLASGGVTLYDRLAATKPALTLEAKQVEVLWRSPLAYEDNAPGRYEVVYPRGFSTSIVGGKTTWSQWGIKKQAYFAPFNWPGAEWYWKGKRFQRGFDGVSLNLVGDGPIGIGQKAFNPNSSPDVATMRGDLDLLTLTAGKTEVRYYSGWVDEALLSPYVAIVPVQSIANPPPNPIQ